jgi:amidophosphoribosyltransferase
MARDAGANKVYMASAAPPVRFPNVYGIDMPTKDELVAHNRTVEQIREIIGCDALIYQDVDAMKSAILKLAPKAGTGHVQLAGFDASCFDGVYVTGDITDGDLTRMRDSRTASAKNTEDQEDNSRLALPNPI